MFMDPMNAPAAVPPAPTPATPVVPAPTTPVVPAAAAAMATPQSTATSSAAGGGISLGGSPSVLAGVTPPPMIGTATTTPAKSAESLSVNDIVAKRMSTARMQAFDVERDEHAQAFTAFSRAQQLQAYYAGPIPQRIARVIFRAVRAANFAAFASHQWNLYPGMPQGFMAPVSAVYGEMGFKVATSVLDGTAAARVREASGKNDFNDLSWGQKAKAAFVGSMKLLGYNIGAAVPAVAFGLTFSYVDIALHHRPNERNIIDTSLAVIWPFAFTGSLLFQFGEWCMTRLIEFLNQGQAYFSQVKRELDNLNALQYILLPVVALADTLFGVYVINELAKASNTDQDMFNNSVNNTARTQAARIALTFTMVATYLTSKALQYVLFTPTPVDDLYTQQELKERNEVVEAATQRAQSQVKGSSAIHTAANGHSATTPVSIGAGAAEAVNGGSSQEVSDVKHSSGSTSGQVGISMDSPEVVGARKRQVGATAAELASTIQNRWQAVRLGAFQTGAAVLDGLTAYFLMTYAAESFAIASAIFPGTVVAGLVGILVADQVLNIKNIYQSRVTHGHDFRVWASGKCSRSSVDSSAVPAGYVNLSNGVSAAPAAVPAPAAPPVDASADVPAVDRPGKCAALCTSLGALFSRRNASAVNPAAAQGLLAEQASAPTPSSPSAV